MTGRCQTLLYIQIYSINYIEFPNLLHLSGAIDAEKKIKQTTENSCMDLRPQHHTKPQRVVLMSLTLTLMGMTGSHALTEACDDSILTVGRIIDPLN